MRADEQPVSGNKRAPRSVALPARKMHQRLVNPGAVRLLGDVTASCPDSGFHFANRICRARRHRSEFPIQHRDIIVMVARRDRKSTRLNSSHTVISYAVFCLKKKKKKNYKP